MAKKPLEFTREGVPTRKIRPRRFPLHPNPPREVAGVKFRVVSNKTVTLTNDGVLIDGQFYYLNDIPDKYRHLILPDH